VNRPHSIQRPLASNRAFPIALGFAWALGSGTAAERPLLPELPLGTGSAAFAGGGTAHASGLNSVFDNPAALSIRDVMQAEAGFMGLAAGVSPYLLFGSRSGDRTSYAMGFFHDARGVEPGDPTPARQGLIAGASWEAASWAALGASMRSVGTGSGVGADGFGVDGDLGAMFRPAGAFWAGMAVRNLQESGVGQEPDGYRTHRSYALSLGTGLAGLHFAGLTLHEPDAYYELRAAGALADPHLVHAFSMACGITPGGMLAFRGTAVLGPSGDPGFAMGTFLNLPVGRSALLFAYTFHSGTAEETGEAGPSHSFSFNFRLGKRRDPLPPMVEVNVDRVRLSAAAPGDTGQVHFRLSATDKAFDSKGSKESKGSNGSKASNGSEGAKPALAPGRSPAGARDRPEGPGPRAGGRKASLEENLSVGEGRILDWNLVVRALAPDGLAGPEVKSFQGRDLPPRVIRWDATDALGRPLSPGFYAFRLEASDLAKNRAETAWQLLEVVAP
jgi:hypothetical protein